MLKSKELKETEVDILVALNSFHEARDKLVYEQNGLDINLPEHLAKKIKKGTFKLISAPLFEQGFVSRREVSDLINKIAGKKNFEKNFSNCIERLKGIVEEKKLIWRRSISQNVEENRTPCTMLRIKPSFTNLDLLEDILGMLYYTHRNEITEETSDHYITNVRLLFIAKKEHPEEFKKRLDKIYIEYASKIDSVKLAEIGRTLLEKKAKKLSGSWNKGLNHHVH